MNALVQTSLSGVESKLSALLTSLTTSPTAAGAPAAAVALLDADDGLSSAIETLRRHQENYVKILRLREEAQQLEDRVKGIVRDIEGFDKEIRTACGDDEHSDSDSDFEEEDDDTFREKGVALKGIKEIDYRLLLDFARRISKYNHEAAADAASNLAAFRKQQEARQADKDVEMAGMNGEVTAEEGKVPVSSVTKSATQWLDDSANVTREVYMLPYPTEERIRMGLMGQVQLTAGDDPDKEVDRLIREAEGLGAAEPPAAPVEAGDDGTRQAAEALKAAANAGSSASSTMRAPAPAPAPKARAKLDLDLYDPDDDDL